jgi:RES domain-containing protein
MAKEFAIGANDDAILFAGRGDAALRLVRGFGEAWIRQRRRAVLLVPSVVARNQGEVLINPQHRDCSDNIASAPDAVVNDARLSGSS